MFTKELRRDWRAIHWLSCGKCQGPREPDGWFGNAMETLVVAKMVLADLSVVSGPPKQSYFSVGSRSV
jgi:hypothetical protein